MATIAVGDLRTGMKLAYDLRDAGGRLLLAARQPVSGTVLGALLSRKVTVLSVKQAEELPRGLAGENGPRRAWLMAVGSADEASVASEKMTPDEAMTPGDLTNEVEPKAEPEPELDAREELRIRVRAIEHRREVAKARAILRRAADEIVQWRSPRWARLPVSVPAAHEPIELADEGSTLMDAAAVEQEVRDRVVLVHRLLARLADGQAVGVGAPRALVEEMIDETARRPGASVASVLAAASGSDEPAVHAYCVAGVCVAMALRLGWEDEDVMAAGLAGMLADAGVALLAWEIRRMPRELTDVEANAVRRHAAYSAALIELMRGEAPGEEMPECVQLAVFQHHERENGSGYPRGVREGQIHDVARVVGAADAFVGMISPRAHRPGLEARTALGEVVRAAGAGELSRSVVRALVEVVGCAVVGEARGAEVVTRMESGRIAA